MTDPLIRFTIPGRAAGKKTSPSVIFPGVAGLGLRKTPRMLAMARRAAKAKGGSRVGAVVFGPRDLLIYLAERIRENPASAAELALAASEAVWPRVVPPPSHEKWKKAALKHLQGVRCLRPVVPEGHLIGLEAVVYLESGQTGDLINFLEALQDCLQEAGIITNDYWVNGFGNSRRDKTDPQRPRIEVAIWDLGEPQEFQLPDVAVRGLAAHKGSVRPIMFSIKAPDGRAVERASAPKGTSRKKLVLQAMALWAERFDEPLPVGSVIAVGDASTAVQGGLF